MRFFAVFSDYVNIRREGRRLIFLKGEKKISLLPKDIFALLIFGKVNLSSEALNLLLSEEKPIYFLTRFGKLKGILFNEFLTSNYNKRLNQYKLQLTDRVEVAKFFVRKKLEGIETFFGIDLKEYFLLLEEAQQLETLLGIEGQASQKMFEKLKQLLRESPLTFEGRSYRPPKDEVNALLSMSYTMVYLTAFPVVVSLGYDPYLSFLHTKRGTHRAFCSDVMEPLRPFITYTLMWEIKRKTFSKGDFKRDPKRGVYLNDRGLDKFLSFYERNLNEVLERLKETLVEFESSFIS